MLRRPIIDEIRVAGLGELQLRWATNSAGNLPTTPFIGGVGLDVNGIAEVIGNFGTLGAGTYWVEYLTSFIDTAVNDIYKNGQGIMGLVAFDTTVDQFGQIDQSAWHSQNGVLPGIAILGHTPVPEPASLAIFGVSLASFALVRRRRQTRSI